MASTVVDFESNNDSGDIIEKKQQICCEDVREISGYVPDEEVYYIYNYHYFL